MIKTSVLAALNKQIQYEQGNALAYEAVSLYFAGLDLHGLGAFMARQGREERSHARRLIRHVVNRGSNVELGAIHSPRAHFESIVDAIKSVRDLERATTDTIHRLFELARREGDYALEVLLHWFIREQVEEEQWSAELTRLVERCHNDPAQMLVLDGRWGTLAKAS